jgi:hypothetical protein
MVSPLLVAGLPMWAVIAIGAVLLIVLAVAILKRLFKLALIVGAVVLGVWLARTLIG